jgi:hypothetical protein
VYREGRVPPRRLDDLRFVPDPEESRYMPRSLITVYDPTAEPRTTQATRAARLQSLRGTRAGILDNGKANAGALMLAVAERLRTAYGVADVVKREKPVAGPPSPEVVRDLSRCDFVLVGSAD